MPSQAATDIVRLRDVSRGDASWLDRWLGMATASVAYDAIGGTQPGATLLRRLRDERQLHAQVIERNAEDVGLVLYRTNAPRKGAAMVEFVGVLPDKSRFGSGMLGAAAAERQMLAQGVNTAFAPAPEIHGIDVYFWIRLGYRPLQRADWPCNRAGVLWMRRDLRT